MNKAIYSKISWNHTTHHQLCTSKQLTHRVVRKLLSHLSVVPSIFLRAALHSVFRFLHRGILHFHLAAQGSSPFLFGNNYIGNSNSIFIIHDCQASMFSSFFSTFCPASFCASAKHGRLHDLNCERVVKFGEIVIMLCTNMNLKHLETSPV